MGCKEDVDESGRFSTRCRLLALLLTWLILTGRSTGPSSGILGFQSGNYKVKATEGRTGEREPGMHSRI